jgi:hypothetical protein
MSLRLGLVVTCFALACGGGSMKVKKGEPQTAREKMAAEQKAENPEADDTGTGKKWGGWRYQGDRKECFFVFGRKCYKTEKAACAAAKCGQGKCETEGAGPATLKCSKKS